MIDWGDEAGRNNGAERKPFSASSGLLRPRGKPIGSTGWPGQKGWMDTPQATSP